MKYLLGTAFSVLFLTFSTLTHADNVNWLGVKAWEGGKPWQQQNGKNAQILQYKPIADTLSNIVPKSEISVLGTYKNASDIRLEEQKFTVFSLCKPHDCPFERATIIIEPVIKSMWVGFYTQSEGAISTRWYGNKYSYLYLPKSLIDEFNRVDEK